MCAGGEAAGGGGDIYPEKPATKVPMSSFFYGRCHMGRHGDISGENVGCVSE